MGQLQGTIHLVSRDMVETLSLVTLRKALPVDLCSLQHAQRTHHIGMCECERILDATVYMTLCCEVDNTINLLCLHQLQHIIEVTDIHLDKLIVGLVLDILQISKVTGISQLIKIDNLIVGMLIDEQTDDM